MSLKLTNYLAHDLGHLIPKVVDSAGLSAEVSSVSNHGTGTGSAVLVLEANKETEYQGIRVIVEVTARRVQLFARMITELKQDMLAKCEEVLAGIEVTDEVTQVAEVKTKLQGRCEPPQEMTMVLKLQTFNPHVLNAAAALLQSGLFQLDSHFVSVSADMAKDQIRISGMQNADNLQFIADTFRSMTVEAQFVGDDGPDPAKTTSGNLEVLREHFEEVLNSLVDIDEYIIVNARKSAKGKTYLEIGVSDERSVDDFKAIVAKVNQLFADGKVVS